MWINSRCVPLLANGSIDVIDPFPSCNDLDVVTLMQPAVRTTLQATNLISRPSAAGLLGILSLRIFSSFGGFSCSFCDNMLSSFAMRFFIDTRRGDCPSGLQRAANLSRNCSLICLGVFSSAASWRFLLLRFCFSLLHSLPSAVLLWLSSRDQLLSAFSFA